MSAAKKLEPNQLLFKEGDMPDAMYVVKSGRLSVFKPKGKGEIELATIGPGQMLGEMAFFDNKPRSASVKATIDTEVIILPFQALQAQFKNFPEWLKIMVKTMSAHLRDANMRIKGLEQASSETKLFPPHTITKLTAILTLVAQKYGEPQPDGAVVIPGGKLRNFTIQIFQEPTHKMQKLMEQYSGLGHMKIEDLGEGKQRITLLKPQLLSDFVEFYNSYLFEDSSKKITIEETELKVLRGLLVFGKQVPKNDKGNVKISLNLMTNESMKTLGYVLTPDNVNTLIEKKLIGEKTSENGELFTEFNIEDIERILPFWEIIYTLDKVPR